MSAPVDTTVLVVDDEPSVTDMYADQLRDAYRVRTAYDGRTALDQLDGDVDVVLLDRRMPGLSGDDVLAEIRSRGVDCGVVMVTAVEPDVDIIELGLDDYVVKPVSRAGLHATVERVRKRLSYRDAARTHFELAAKYAALRSHRRPSELDGRAEFAELEERLSTVRHELEALDAELLPDDFDIMLRNFVPD